MGKHRPGKGRSAKKARAGALNTEEEYSKCPHTFIFNRNRVGKNVSELIRDMRRVMEPYTATRLKTRRNNHLKDFVSAASLYNVSHLVMFTKTKVGIYMKVGRLPHGPTLTFKVSSYSLCRDVISSLKHHHMEPKQFQHHPLLVMNNFGGDGMTHKLMATMWQNMFPSIRINKAKLNDFKRCVILNYNPEDKTIEFRHYNVHVVPVGLSRAVKKLVRSKVPNMAKYSDISDYVMKDGNLSESEAEQDGPLNEVTLPQHVSGRGNIKLGKSAIRLTEIGPRMTLELIKIQEGLSEGQVLHHEYTKKDQDDKVSKSDDKDIDIDEKDSDLDEKDSDEDEEDENTDSDGKDSDSDS